MRSHLLFSIICCTILVFSNTSCNKDDYRNEFIGDWIFKKQSIEEGTYYYQDMGGTWSESVYEENYSWINYNGFIRKGDRSNELVIDYGKKEEKIHVFVYANGDLFLKGEKDYEKLENAPIQAESWQGKQWNVSNGEYVLLTGYHNGISGWGGGTATTTRIIGFKK